MNNRIIKNQLAKPFKMNINKYYTLSIGLILLVFSDIYAQQDPQYTQYMYNTQVVNPGYAGSKEVLSFGALMRSQWVGLDGAPKTGTFTIDGPVSSAKNMGLGLSIVVDEIGPAIETNFTVDYSYTIKVGENKNVAFGLKAGMHILILIFFINCFFWIEIIQPFLNL